MVHMMEDHQLRCDTSYMCTLPPSPIRESDSSCIIEPDLCKESSMQDIPYDTSHVPIDYDDSVNVNVKEVRNKITRKDARRERSEMRSALERDVLQLQKQLIIEINMRNALYRGFSRPLGSLPRIYADMPVETRNLLLEVAVLEEEIVSLEKQVIHLGREIEIEGMPALDKETIWESTDQNTSPKKAEIVVSPLVSPRDSARINSKASLPSRKSIDQKNKPSRPSFSAGKVLENKSSSIAVSVPAPRKSLDNGSSIKSSKSPKDFSEPRRISSLVPPQKPQTQRNISFPKVTPTNTREPKSRRLSLTRKEPLEPTGAMHTVPFIPIKLSPPKGHEESTAPESPAALVSPSDVGRSYSHPAKVKTGNRGKPPIIENSRFGKKESINTKVAPKTRTVKALGTTRSAGQDKGRLDTPIIPRHTLAHDTILTRKTMSSSTATSEQSMTTKKSTSESSTSTSLNCESNLQKAVDGEPDNDTNNMDIPSTISEHDGDCKPSHLSPDLAKISQANFSPSESIVRDLDPGLDQVTDLVLSSEDVVKLLKTICGNLQEKQPHLSAESGSSSQTSIPTILPSANSDDFEMGEGVNINFRLDDAYSGSFRIKRSASTKYMRHCYSGEVLDALDPYISMNRENISTRPGFHQRLMS